MKAEIYVLNSNALEELDELISVFEEVFERDNSQRPGKAHLQSLLNRDTFFAVVAKAEGKIIAGLTIYVLHQYYSEKPLAYIFDLAVLAKYQRKGVGRKLIEFSVEYCRHLGFEEVFVQADKVDEYAIDFYRSTEPTEEEQVVHFYYTLTNDRYTNS